MTPQQRLRDAAIQYAQRGWPVHPLVVGGKTPATAHGFKDATTDLAQVESWWAQADYNIGLAVPPGYVVVDEDPRNGGAESIRRLVDELGPVPPTLIARTRAGGYHYWFRSYLAPEQTSGSLGAGVDVKIAGKGYVVAPPSRVEPGEYEWVETAEVAHLPSTWTKRLRRAPRPRPTAVTDPTLAEAMISWHCQVLSHAVPGSRNADLYRAARTLAERGCLTADAERRLAVVADDLGLDGHEIARTIGSAAGAVTR
ncbi:bifunctional DNA primase/polymerase [Dietzia sp. MNB45]|uniref:bifunctional DNA primase/polymerase n=1 Tax=Dietzia sp. MNB45 TaxID=3238800 RepID=UPI003F7EC37B